MISLMIIFIFYVTFNIIFYYSYYFVTKSSDRLWILKATRKASLVDEFAALKMTQLFWIWKVGF